MKAKSGYHQRKHVGLSAQALVEFALILPLVLLLILGAMDFGRMFYTKIVLTNAAREGANYLSRNPETKFCEIPVCGELICEEFCYFPKTWTAIEAEGKSSGITIAKDDVVWEKTVCCTVGEPLDIVIEKKVDLIFGKFLESRGIIGPINVNAAVRMVVHP